MHLLHVCTISDGLLWILHTLHDMVFHDWSLSIVFLVLIVRRACTR